MAVIERSSIGCEGFGILDDDVLNYCSGFVFRSSAPET